MLFCKTSQKPGISASLSAQVLLATIQHQCGTGDVRRVRPDEKYNAATDIGFGIADSPERRFLNMLLEPNCVALMKGSNLWRPCVRHDAVDADPLRSPLDRRRTRQNSYRLFERRVHTPASNLVRGQRRSGAK